jgi:hypothetical protein
MGRDWDQQSAAQSVANRERADHDTTAYLAAISLIACELRQSPQEERKEVRSYLNERLLKLRDSIANKQRSDLCKGHEVDEKVLGAAIQIILDETRQKPRFEYPSTSDVARIVLTGLVKAGDNHLRAAVISRPESWVMLAFTPLDKLLAAVILLFPVAIALFKKRFASEAMAGIEGDTGPVRPDREPAISLRQLIRQDLTTSIYDVGIHRKQPEVREYSGVIHWVRDLIEKCLSLLLVVFFIAFLARLIGYVVNFVDGELWRLALVCLDINIALVIVGCALIVDGLIQVSAMTDAPGISHTLDAVIVILAGIIVMLVEASPGEAASVAFGLREPQWLAPLLAGMIATLFGVRWFVQHLTLKDWRGDRGAEL